VSLQINRNAFLQHAAKPRRYQDVPLPEMGGQTIRVQAMTALERGQFEAQFVPGKNGKVPAAKLARVRELLAVQCCIDESGRQLFDAKDVDTLGSMPAAILERIANAARELSGIGDDDYAEMLGNSGATPASDSPENSRSESAHSTPTTSEQN
jgi:hypothetical protein